jgi:hypothetical protein
MKTSKALKLIKIMSRGRSITNREIIKLIDTNHPTGVIRDLRNMGVDIDSEWAQKKNKPRYKIYFIPKSSLKSVKKAYI